MTIDLYQTACPSLNDKIIVLDFSEGPLVFESIPVLPSVYRDKVSRLTTFALSKSIDIRVASSFHKILYNRCVQSWE